jgi:hypothetical protein
LTAAVSQQQRTAWFSCLGSPLAAADLINARAYLDALVYPAEVPTVQVGNWLEAERIVRAPDWDHVWWEQEERERDCLKTAIEHRLGSMRMLECLTAHTDPISDAIHAAAIIAMARTRSGADGIVYRTSGADAMIRAASGAATMAEHEFALAQLAACGPDHLFMRKYALFKSGRWPLGVLRGAFHLF